MNTGTKQQELNYDRIAYAIEFITQHAHEQPSLEAIAEKVHLSPFHFQRLFTEWAGVSPKKFVQYLTIGYAKQLLKNGSRSLVQAALDSGLSGSARLHDLFVNIEGMTPGEYRNGGEGLFIRYSFGTSVFGNYLVASTSRGVSNLYFFDGHPDEAVHSLAVSWPHAGLIKQQDEFHKKVSVFLNGGSPGTLPLHVKGTEFQLKVWEALLKIPQGDLLSYGVIANNIHMSSASRAVGTAIGSNPVGFIIPCHRVIRSAGIIGEYRWGSTRKKAMIGWEASQLNPHDE